MELLFIIFVVSIITIFIPILGVDLDFDYARQFLYRIKLGIFLYSIILLDAYKKNPIRGRVRE
ncbi:hypothetical protein BDA99DRAFT_10572 [Phascolomyces articulosus]|uniref:Uncharacterized protein n=1 Tax=Phascolomyces articulosus TaxID=60185 RepID=A0AAD5PKX2_9FUNG|nr:hypothetical protein BDA99DRAFT_10572 [Phascolomyces articulosus]